MPNWVENHLKYNGDETEIAEMLEKIKMDDFTIGTIDFDKIIPMPKSLDIECGSRTNEGIKMLKEYLDNPPESLISKNITEDELRTLLNNHGNEIEDDEQRAIWNLGVTAAFNSRYYGATTWYDWSIANWDTKWNACGYQEGTDYSDNDMIWFQSAWSSPFSVIRKLSEMYPNIEFTLQYADEDLGSNCGEIVFKNGEKTREYTPNNRKESLEFAAEVWGDDLSDYGYHINALGTDYVNTEVDEYELIDILDKTCLYADERLTLGDIPQGLSLYHIRRSDDDERFATLEKSVTVNHGGSILVDEPFDLGEKGYIEFTDETYPNFLDQTLTINDYVNDNYNTEMNNSDESEGFDICQ